MQKISGHICDNCRTMFYPGDKIVELCEKCANTVWCVFDMENSIPTLCCIHRSKESAEIWVNKNKEHAPFLQHDYEIEEWFINDLTDYDFNNN